MATQPDTTQNPQDSVDVDSLSGAGFSLADLADIDVTDIEEVRFVDLPAGVYDWEIVEGKMLEDDKDGVRRFKIEFELKVLEAVAVLEAGIDKDTLVNKIHTERFFIDPSKDEADVKKAIGRVRAFVTDTGGDSRGKLGPIVRDSKGRTFRCPVVKQKDKDDPTRSYARLKLTPRK
jgi:hypothetical protein